MQQVKLFKGVESELGALESEINEWIATSGCRLISLTGNIAPQTHIGQSLEMFSTSDVLVIVMYEDGNG